ncbi:hypothetical protein L1049_022452 [Liquidambar formosana]|uniref:Helicase MOV-10-like beta-barrel domain-containing protein n=1 Tax=Liquidambar formosana TaxID=63359 RepID=A0AAP0REB0_LIQFO
MSVFLEILRCILCCEEEHRDRRNDETFDRNPDRQSHSYNTFVSSAPAYNYPVRSSDSDTIIQFRNANHTNSSQFNSFGKSSKPPEKPSASSVQPRVPVDSGFTIKRWAESTNEFSQKAKISIPSPPPSNVFQVKPLDPKTNKLSEQRPPPSSPKPPPSSSISSLSSSRQSSSSVIPPPSSLKQILSPAPSSLTNQQAKSNYVLVQNAATPIYVIPKDIEDLIKKDIVPEVLKKPLSPSAYRDYFAALLYAEDFYIEKWNDFKLKNVTLELHEAAIYRKSNKERYLNGSDDKDDKTFVAFEMDSVPERRPFLLSRDFVFVQPCGRMVEPYKGVIYRVVRSTRVLVEFGEDFHSQHKGTLKYDVSFSFNRFCLKRAHQAVEAASDPSFRNFLFPNSVSRNSPLISPTSVSSNHELDFEPTSAMILSIKGPPPYVVEGQLSVTMPSETNARRGKDLSRTGLVVREAVRHIYRTSPKCRILVCAPTNSTCDVLMRSLKNEIRESDMFRANAAFRELDGVPFDILPSCVYKDECFTCPSLRELRDFNVIFSTFVSSFRLHGVGITAGHFSHIFLVDASSVTEPETMVALANLADEKTAVVVTGARRNCSSWVRSEIARKRGLRISYFERLCESKLYSSSDRMLITRL